MSRQLLLAGRCATFTTMEKMILNKALAIGLNETKGGEKCQLDCITEKQPRTNVLSCNHFAEGTRFELVVRLPVRQFSKLLVSATHPPFRELHLKRPRQGTKALSRTAKIQKFIVSAIFFVCL